MSSKDLNIDIDEFFYILVDYIKNKYMLNSYFDRKTKRFVIIYDNNLSISINSRNLLDYIKYNSGDTDINGALYEFDRCFVYALLSNLSSALNCEDIDSFKLLQ